MKLLSAKNKKLGIAAFALLGAAIIGAVLYTAYKGGARTLGEFWNAVKNFFTEVFGINSLLILIGAGMTVYGFAFAETTPGVLTALLIGTLTTGVGQLTTINLTYLPEWISFTAATQLTGLKVTVQGEGPIFDTDANGITHWGVNRIFGQVANTYVIRLSNGLITNKNVILDFTNSAAQTPAIYADNHQYPNPTVGPMYLMGMRQPVFANAGQEFDDFATLSLPSLAATDEVTVTYVDGAVQRMTRADMQVKLGMTQNVVSTPIYQLDNWNQRIAKVNVLAAANQTAYVQKWARA
jgi:hypothetical protein